MSERSGKCHDRAVHPATVGQTSMSSSSSGTVRRRRARRGIGQVGHQHRAQVGPLGLPPAGLGDHCDLASGSVEIAGRRERAGSHRVGEDGGAGPPPDGVERQRGRARPGRAEPSESDALGHQHVAGVGFVDLLADPAAS